MAHYVEKHRDPMTGVMIPGYWNPDYSLKPVSVVPCDTKEQAEEFEREADEFDSLDEKQPPHNKEDN